MLYFKTKKKTYLERFWGCLFFNRVEVGGMLKTNIYVNKSFPSLWHITTLLLGYEFFKAANSSSALEVKLAYWPFHNSTYDLFTFHETSDFIIFLTKSWGLEKNISYGVCFGFLAQYFFLILNSWSNHSYFWNWKAFDITYIYLFVASFVINFFRWFILQTKACESSKHATDGWTTNK